MKQFFILIFFISSLFSDPFNVTQLKIDLNSSTPTIELRFISFNLQKPLKIEEVNSKTLSTNRQKAINYITSKIKIKNCQLKLKSFKTKNEVSTTIKYDLKCPKEMSEFDMKYDLFFEFDKKSSGVAKLTTKNSIQTFIFSPQKDELKIKLNKKISPFEYFKLFLIKGIWHIWMGIDHIMFLLMLILPVTLIYKNFFTSTKETIKIVTAFTISHSITLSLSMFHILQPDARIIETLIAFSVFVTAILNLTSIKIKHWLLAFGFGFIHGFGFANVLKELNLPTQNFLATLFGFNLGVEVGQIAIVLVIMPFMYVFRNKQFYKYFVMTISVIIAIISFLWMIDRWWELKFMPF